LRKSDPSPVVSGTANPGSLPAPKVRYQTDWFPQAEHGGHHQALAKGFYKEAGIDVGIITGGPGSPGINGMLSGLSDIAMGRSDDVITIRQSGTPTRDRRSPDATRPAGASPSCGKSGKVLRRSQRQVP